MPRPVLAAEIVSRAGHSLPVGQAAAGTPGSLGTSPLPWRGHALTNMRPAASEPGHCALISNDPSSACAPRLRNVALDSTCPALYQTHSRSQLHFLQQPSHELAITLDREPRALHSTGNRPRTAVQGCVLRPLCAGDSQKQPLRRDHRRAFPQVNPGVVGLAGLEPAPSSSSEIDS
jgi:hypothetical protein